MKATLTVLAVAAIVATFTFFGLFLADDLRLGGDALNGRTEAGRFYVVDHGKATEVSEEQWRRNRSLAITMLCLFPFGMAGMAYVNFAVVIPRLVFRGTPVDERERRAAQIAGSGPAIATSNAGGGFGWFGITKGMMSTDVHPRGLVLRLRFMGRVAVEASEITAVREETRFRQRFVVVEHRSPQAKSPIRLTCGKDVAFAEAVNGLAARRA
jgi:hypothetical protein